MKFIAIFVAAALASTAAADVERGGQCGGINYSGPTQCVQGANCYKLSDFYSQCL
ncbi:hypothetical protein TWF506_006319 [Arthrobotrys conoides]|uniref:CBM1 domain-containing protein n=1 Tax=Arthrobotrys conoides TaxID=74498 RepID=A0AAN8RYP3_9PEZI